MFCFISCLSVSLIFECSTLRRSWSYTQRGVTLFNFNKALAVSTGFQHVVPRGIITKAARSALQIPWNEKLWRPGPPVSPTSSTTLLHANICVLGHVTHCTASSSCGGLKSSIRSPILYMKKWKPRKKKPLEFLQLVHCSVRVLNWSSVVFFRSYSWIPHYVITCITGMLLAEATQVQVFPFLKWSLIGAKSRICLIYTASLHLRTWTLSLCLYSAPSAIIRPMTYHDSGLSALFGWTFQTLIYRLPLSLHEDC